MEWLSTKLHDHLNSFCETSSYLPVHDLSCTAFSSFMISSFLNGNTYSCLLVSQDSIRVTTDMLLHGALPSLHLRCACICSEHLDSTAFVTH